MQLDGKWYGKEEFIRETEKTWIIRPPSLKVVQIVNQTYGLYPNIPTEVSQEIPIVQSNGSDRISRR